MVGTLTWVLVGLAAYTLVAMTLKSRGVIPDFVNLSGPIVTVHTQSGKRLLDRLAAPKRVWRAWGNVGVGFSLIVIAGSFFVVLLSGYLAASEPASQPISNPQNLLVIPGVNEFLPLSAAPEILFGLAVGLVLHEGGHGLLCRVEDIDIESMGLVFLTVVPVGAFVEPNEENRRDSSRGSQVRMFAAGVTNNFAISIVAFLLLFGPVAGSIAVTPGVPVGDTIAGSGAEQAGVERGDVIQAVGDTEVANQSEFDSAMANDTGDRVQLTMRDGREVTVNKTLVVTRAVPGTIDGIDLSGDEPPRITAVNGTTVAGKQAFDEAVRDRDVVEIQTAESGSATLRVGAYISQVDADGPLGNAGAPTDGQALTITAVNGTSIHSSEELARVLDQHEPGATVPVTAYHDGDHHTYNATLAPGSDGGASLGVRATSGVAGLVVDDVGIEAYPADSFLAALGGDTAGIGPNPAQRIGFTLFMPFLSIVNADFGFNFAGFTGGVENFYYATGPLSFLGGGVLLLANLLFWTAWINIQLAWFNCIPTYPLDGGHILRGSAESIVSRLPIDRRRTAVSLITGSVSGLMVMALFFMIFAPALL